MPLKPVSDGAAEGGDSLSASPWEDASSFHTKGREETAVPFTVRIPNTTARAIARIVQSGKFPGLETNSDAMRDAAWRWVRWMADNLQDEDMAQQLDVQRSRWKMEAELQKKEQIRGTVDIAQKVLEDPGCGEKTKRKVLTELSDLALKIEDSELRREMIQLVAKHR